MSVTGEVYLWIAIAWVVIGVFGLSFRVSKLEKMHQGPTHYRDTYGR